MSYSRTFLLPYFLAVLGGILAESPSRFGAAHEICIINTVLLLLLFIIII